MKKIALLTGAFTALLVIPAFSQGGNIHGNESRGEPINSSYRASGVDAQTGLTPGGQAARAKKAQKKKRTYVTTTGSASRR